MHKDTDTATMNSPADDYMAVFEDICREKNLRITPQRLEIYRELAQATDHPTAEELHQRLIKKMPTMSLDTVYRTLATLISHNLVHKVGANQNQARYEVQHLHHHHIICRKCNKIMDFTWNVVDQSSIPDELGNWGKIEHVHVVVYGVCADCADEEY